MTTVFARGGMDPGNWSLEEEREDPSIEYLVRPGFPPIRPKKTAFRCFVANLADIMYALSGL